MAETSRGGGAAHNASVRIVNGPVPADDPSHQLRLDAAHDLVARCKRQLAGAEAELARLLAEPKEN